LKDASFHGADVSGRKAGYPTEKIPLISCWFPKIATRNIMKYFSVARIL